MLTCTHSCTNTYIYSIHMCMHTCGIFDSSLCISNHKMATFSLLKQVLEEQLTRSCSMANRPGVSTRDHWIHCGNIITLNTVLSLSGNVLLCSTLPMQKHSLLCLHTYRRGHFRNSFTCWETDAVGNTLVDMVALIACWDLNSKMFLMYFLMSIFSYLILWSICWFYNT